MKIQKSRKVVQFIFVVLSLWIGIEFYFFVRYFEQEGIANNYPRPPGAEAYLPISSLMNFLYFIKTGTIHHIHPAGFYIFCAVVLSSMALGKSFCSWVCVVGTFSECWGNLGERVLKKKRKLPLFFDVMLRGVKYIILFLFLYMILGMTSGALKDFLDSPYNLIADIKMYYFFVHLSKTAFFVILFLIIFSFLIKNFWCRYLCPYGALLGLVGLLSITKIKRETTRCIDCEKCTNVCPSKIVVHKLKTVVSDECTSCLQCVESCPVPYTLQNKFINKKIVPFLILFIFSLTMFIAVMRGEWANNVSAQKYMEIYRIKDKLTHY